MTVLYIFEHYGSEGWLRTVLNHNLNLSSLSQLLLLCVEGLSNNLVPGGLCLLQLESVKVVQTVPELLNSHPLGPCGAFPSSLNLQHRIISIK